MKQLLIIIFSITGLLVNAQITLLMEGETYSNSDNHWNGVWVSRDEPTLLFFKNNSITTINESGYMINCGSDSPAPEDTRLDNAVLSGNVLDWNGTEPAAITHGMICGYSINYSVKNNLYDRVPYAIVVKSGVDGNNMEYTSGGYSYNVFKNAKNSMIIKGMDGVGIYNNTFYRDLWNPIVITNNADCKNGSPCENIKIKNNIFYTRENVAAIRIQDEESLSTFESDYNVYYCEGGDSIPTFTVRSTTYTLTEWQDLGYDIHSVVVNPEFIDTINFVPSVRLDYGTNLGSEFAEGLSIDAVWSTSGDPGTTTQAEGAIWQAGARIFGTSDSIPLYISSIINNDTPDILDMTYNMNLADTLPDASSFSVMVNSVVRDVKSVEIEGSHVLLTLADSVIHGDMVTIAYTKPKNNPLQTVSGDQAFSINALPVTNDLISYISPDDKVPVKIFPNPAREFITFQIFDSARMADYIRITDLSGRIVFSREINPDYWEFTIPVNFTRGMYIVQLVSENRIFFTRKQFVTR